MQLLIVTATTTMATLSVLNVREDPLADVVATEAAAAMAAAAGMAVGATVAVAVTEEEEDIQEEDTEVEMTEDRVVGEAVLHSRVDDLITE